MRSESRRTLGQWYTPEPVVDLALALAGAGRRLLDPSCGDGAFLTRAAALGAGDERVGVEVDGDAAAAARARGGAAIVHGDLFEAGLPARLGGFDLVVGNPPWVRADRLGAAQRTRIAAAIAADWPGLDGGDGGALVARADLAAACLLRGLALTRPGGRVAMVLSTALLDADYAAPLWRAVTAAARPLALVAAPAERWFADAAVNAMIAVLERRAGAAAVRDPDVVVARLTVATAEAARRAPGLDGLAAVAEVRRAAADDPARWAAALRAPATWFGLAGAADGALVPLAELADVRRGTTSGANEVFYLRRSQAIELGLEPEVVAPLVRSPYNGSPAPIAIDPGATPLVALAIPADAALERLPRARAWLDAHADAAARPSLRGREPWWALPARPARLFLAKAYGPRFIQRLAPVPVIGDQRVYALAPRPGVELEVLAAALNSTWTALALESLGRASMGHGALEWTVADAARLPVLDVRRATPPQREALVAALRALAGRNVEHVLVERRRADRDALDRAAAALAPGLDRWLGEAWDALLGSVRLRDRWLLPAL